MPPCPTNHACRCTHLLRVAEQQTSVTSSPYVDDSGRMWMRPTPVPLAEYHVPPEQVPIILHTLWLQGAHEWGSGCCDVS